MRTTFKIAFALIAVSLLVFVSAAPANEVSVESDNQTNVRAHTQSIENTNAESDKIKDFHKDVSEETEGELDVRTDMDLENTEQHKSEKMELVTSETSRPKRWVLTAKKCRKC